MTAIRVRSSSPCWEKGLGSSVSRWLAHFPVALRCPTRRSASQHDYEIYMLLRRKRVERTTRERAESWEVAVWPVCGIGPGRVDRRPEKSPYVVGAEGGIRTPTVLLPPAPQAGASASSATSASARDVTTVMRAPGSWPQFTSAAAAAPPAA